MTNPFKAQWSKKGHSLCLGHWIISYCDLPIALPDKQLNNDMGTWGVYDPIYDNDPEFCEGKLEDDWVITNADWLIDVFIAHDIEVSEQNMRWFYQAVNEDDWRCGSCGGCM